MVVVLDAPAMEGIEQRHKGNMPDQVIDPELVGKGAMTAVMPNHKPACECGACPQPSKGEQIPRARSNGKIAQDSGK
jgi:hypothetical protein